MKFSQKVTIILIYFALFIFLFYNYFNLTIPLDKSNYLILLASYIICGIAFLLTVFKKNYYIFEPYTIVSLLYLAIMIYRPCLDILNQNYYVYGVFVMNGCAKATIIFTICFLIFTFIYNFKFKVGNRHDNKDLKQEREGKRIQEYSNTYSKKVRLTCIILFIIGFLSAILFYKTANYNPLAFIKNLNQGENTYLYSSNFKFLGKITYLMIIPWLYVCAFDKNKLLKILLTLLMFLIFLIGGARYIIVISIIAYIILPYISARKSFSFKKATIIFAVLLILCDIIAYTRVGARQGRSIDYSEITNFVEITDVFDSDLTIYKPLYCVVEKIPSIVPYQHGKGLIGYSIVSFMPRVLFPWKAKFDIMADVIKLVMNETAMKAGLAMPNIGEFYMEFGVLGCIVCIWIFALICKHMKKLYLKETSGINEIILYSVLFPFLMQLVCRGYLAVQLNSLLFIVIPYFILKRIGKNTAKDETI